MPRPPRLPRFSLGLSLIPFKSRHKGDEEGAESERGHDAYDVFACHVPSPRSRLHTFTQRKTGHKVCTDHRPPIHRRSMDSTNSFRFLARVPTPVWPTLLLQSGSEEDGKCSLRVSADGAQPRPPACRVCSASGCSFSMYFRVTIVDSTCVYVVTRGLIVGFIMLALQGLQAGEIVTRLHQ